MKLPKFNQKGITHLLAPIAFVVVFAAIGGAAYLRTHALTYTTASGVTYITINGVVNRSPYAHVPIVNNTTGAGGATVSGSTAVYSFNSIVVGDTYTIQAYKNITTCISYWSKPIQHVAQSVNVWPINMTVKKTYC